MAEVKVAVKNTVEGSHDVQQYGNRLASLIETATKAGLAFAAIGVAAKKAFDLSREGAQIRQLEESFRRMNAAVFQTPDLLDQMSEAARGTIKETDLMAGLLKLTAGASDELAQRFAQAAPQLLEIAKASNKLNPALGDTAFLYDSIATGIKRASPLILDNLGIVVKVGEANEQYAASIGKTVDQLTAEEKQMALLNATLEAGGQLIRQVGGDVESQTDSWDQLTVKVGQTKDQFLEFIAVLATPLVDAMAAVATSGEAMTVAFDQINQLAKESTSFDDFRRRLEEANLALGDRSAQEYWFNLGQIAREAESADRALLGLTRRMAPQQLNEADRAVRSTAEGMKEYESAITNAGKAAETFGDHAQMVNDALAEQNRRLFDTFQSAVTATDNIVEYDEATGGLVTSVDAMNQSIWNSIAATDADATSKALAGAALGIYSEEAANAAIQTALVEQAIRGWAEAAAEDGQITQDEIEEIQVKTRALIDDLNDMPPLTIEDQQALDAVNEVGNALSTIANTDWTANINVSATIPNFGGIGSEYDYNGNPVDGYAPPPSATAPPAPPSGGGAPAPVSPGYGAQSVGGGRSGVTIVQNFYGYADPAAVAGKVADVVAPRG